MPASCGSWWNFEASKTNRLRCDDLSFVQILRIRFPAFKGRSLQEGRNWPLSGHPYVRLRESHKLGSEEHMAAIQPVGCYFHFCQALRRRASQTPSLSIHIKGNSIENQVLKTLMRLALLPLERIEKGLEEVELLAIREGVGEKFVPFFGYFRDTWMRRYSPSDWCVANRPRRTNCNLEGYNNTIKQEIPLNPGPWVFLERLQNLARSATAKFDADKRRRRPVKDRSQLSVAIVEATDQLTNGRIDILEFLTSLANHSAYHRIF